MASDDSFLDIYPTIGSVLCILSFFASWIYCVVEYGFLFGLGLGWLPSIVVGLAVRFLWGFGVFALIIIILIQVHSYFIH